MRSPSCVVRTYNITSMQLHQDVLEPIGHSQAKRKNRQSWIRARARGKYGTASDVKIVNPVYSAVRINDALLGTLMHSGCPHMVRGIMHHPDPFNRIV